MRQAAEKYQTYECSKCGAQARNSYIEPDRTNMTDRQLCYTCNFWFDLEKKIQKEHRTMTIIGGHLYTPGNRTTGQFRGMAGRRFDIEYIEPSVYAGQRITTFDLWAGSTMPEDIAGKYPDTARFLGGAEKHERQDGFVRRCWNPSDGKSDPYPLPRTLRASPGAPS